MEFCCTMGVQASTAFPPNKGIPLAGRSYSAFDKAGGRGGGLTDTGVVRWRLRTVTGGSCDKGS